MIFIVSLLILLIERNAHAIPITGTYLHVGHNTTDHSVPPPPNCRIIPEENKIEKTQAGLISIWTYKTNTTDKNWDYIVTKQEITTVCTVYFFGAQEQSIKSVKTTPIREGETSEELTKLIEGVTTSGVLNYKEEISYECSWTGTREKTDVIYLVEKVKSQFSPDGKLIYPILDRFPPSRVTYRSGKLYVFNVNTKFDICDLELYGAYPGIISHHELISTITIPSQKELFYVDLSEANSCKSVTVYASRGGYLISYTTDPTMHTSYPNHITKRHTSSNAQQESRAIKNILERYFRSLDLWRERREYVPVIISEQSDPPVRRSRSLQTGNENNPPNRLWNFQLSLTRAEMQWGLQHLAEKNHNERIELAKEICLNRYSFYVSAMATLKEHPEEMAHYITGGYHPHAQYDEGWVRINHSKILTKAEIHNPLTCRGQSCLLDFPEDHWIEGSTGVITRQHPKDTGPPNSLVIEIEPGVFIDVVSKKPIINYNAHTLYPEPDPVLLYSFNSSELMADIILDRSSKENDIIKEGDKLVKQYINVDSITRSVGSFFYSLSGWAKEAIFSVFSMFFIIFGIYLCVRLLIYICSKRASRKITREGEGFMWK